MSIDITPYISRTALDVALADYIKQVIERAIAARGKAVLAFSGGNTPMGLFSILSGLDIEWSKVIITLVDDRWVTENDDASNAGMIKQTLISKVAGVTFIPLVVNAESRSAFEAEAEINSRLQNDLPVLDIAILGMGEDGHTASFFPGSPELSAALNRDTQSVALATTPTNAAHDRMTLSLAFLLRARELVLHITGKPKQWVLEQAQASANNLNLPISYILHQTAVPFTLFYAD